MHQTVDASAHRERFDVQDQPSRHPGERGVAEDRVVANGYDALDRLDLHPDDRIDDQVEPGAAAGSSAAVHDEERSPPLDPEPTFLQFVGKWSLVRRRHPPWPRRPRRRSNDPSLFYTSDPCTVAWHP